MKYLFSLESSVGIKATLILVFLSLAVSHAGAAESVTFESRSKITADTAFNISVYPGKAGYAGTGAYSASTAEFGDGTVEAYRFWHNVGGGSGVNGVDSYADDGSGSISQITQTKANPPTYGVGGDVWVTSDPGAGYSTTPDYEDGVIPTTNTTASGAYNVSGTINVSNLISGTVYVLAGAFQNTVTVELEMSGGGPLLTASETFASAGDRNLHVFDFSFTNSERKYGVITYTFQNTGSNASNRSRFMGIVVDGEGPPSGTVFIVQ